MMNLCVVSYIDSTRKENSKSNELNKFNFAVHQSNFFDLLPYNFYFLKLIDWCFCIYLVSFYVRRLLNFFTTNITSLLAFVMVDVVVTDLVMMNKFIKEIVFISILLLLYFYRICINICINMNWSIFQGQKMQHYKINLSKLVLPMKHLILCFFRILTLNVG